MRLISQGAYIVAPPDMACPVRDNHRLSSVGAPGTIDNHEFDGYLHHTSVVHLGMGDARWYG